MKVMANKWTNDSSWQVTITVTLTYHVGVQIGNLFDREHFKKYMEDQTKLIQKEVSLPFFSVVIL